MKWTAAIVEMSKDNNKIFMANDSYWKMNDKGELVAASTICPVTWGTVNVLSKEEQLEDWVEYSFDWQDVDYAEFVEWYCNPANVNSTFQVKSQFPSGWQEFENRHNWSPLQIREWDGYRIRRKV